MAGGTLPGGRIDGFGPRAAGRLAYARPVDPVAEPLQLYGRASEHPSPEWSWVEGKLERAEFYWVIPRGGDFPHPRPVWGVWQEQRLLLSIGSPKVRRLMDEDGRVTVHLEGGIDVVIVEGRLVGTSTDQAGIDRYDSKYDWRYDVETYGPLTVIAAETVIAWRLGGTAGRDGFRTAGRWRLTQ
jgi:hypothetical protein